MRYNRLFRGPVFVESERVVRSRSFVRVLMPMELVLWRHTLLRACCRPGTRPPSPRRGAPLWVTGNRWRANAGLSLTHRNETRLLTIALLSLCQQTTLESQILNLLMTAIKLLTFDEIWYFNPFSTIYETRNVLIWFLCQIVIRFCRNWVTSCQGMHLCLEQVRVPLMRVLSTA